MKIPPQQVGGSQPPEAGPRRGRASSSGGVMGSVKVNYPEAAAFAAGGGVVTHRPRLGAGVHAQARSGQIRRAVHAGPVAGLISQVLLLTALALTVGMGRTGWVVGIGCGVIVDVALTQSLSRYRLGRLGPADWVTLARATLATGVAALVTDSFGQSTTVATLVSLTTLALALDAVDGWIATDKDDHVRRAVRR